MLLEKAWEEEKEKQLLLEKARRMIKIIKDISVDIGFPYFIEIMRGIAYDVKEGAICGRGGQSRFVVKIGPNPSAAQLELSPFAIFLAHLSPEDLGISSQNC